MRRNRPIPRSRDYPESSLRYELILGGAVRVYPGGREVCVDSPAGWREYKKRVEIMVQRQNFRCSLCGRSICVSNATFDHQRRRGAGSAWRDDRLENGKAAHWVCNVERG